MGIGESAEGLLGAQRPHTGADAFELPTRMPPLLKDRAVPKRLPPASSNDACSNGLSMRACDEPLLPEGNREPEGVAMRRDLTVGVAREWAVAWRNNDL